MNRSAKIAVALTVGLLSVPATSAFAATPWELAHPRRDQVNDRLAFQNARINHELREGELTPYQAWRLHRDDRIIGGEEHTMAAFNGGYITPAQQRALNQQENTVSRWIGR
jgi:hypothetical protein